MGVSFSFSGISSIQTTKNTMIKVVACVIAVSCCISAVFGQTWDASGAGSSTGGGAGGSGMDLFGSSGGNGNSGGMGMGFNNPFMKWMMYRQMFDMNRFPAMFLSGLMGNQGQGGQGGSGMGGMFPWLLFRDGFGF